MISDDFRKFQIISDNFREFQDEELSKCTVKVYYEFYLILSSVTNSIPDKFRNVKH
jgi:hypothetical protein